jgi:hypothetical protein
MDIFKVNNILDLLNILFVSINIFSALYIKYLIYKSNKLYKFCIINVRERKIIDIILAIEMLFFAAIYVFLQSNRNEQFGGITDPSLLLYTVAELVKGLSFMLYLFLNIIEIKKGLKKLFERKGIIHGCDC